MNDGSSLPERIRAGDLGAFGDPALPLHLLADGPGAEWWCEGCVKGVVELNCALAKVAGKRHLTALIRLISDIGWKDTTHLERCEHLLLLVAEPDPGWVQAIDLLLSYAPQEAREVG